MLWPIPKSFATEMSLIEKTESLSFYLTEDAARIAALLLQRLR
jgi:hypothetical protein